MELSSRLVQCRKERGLSQEELAGRLGVSRQAVSKWETGEALPDLQKALLLSDALGVSLDELCGRGAPEGPAKPEARAKSEWPDMPKGRTKPEWPDMPDASDKAKWPDMPDAPDKTDASDMPYAAAGPKTSGTRAKRSPWRAAAIIVLCLAIGFLAGFFLPARTPTAEPQGDEAPAIVKDPDETPAAPLPDVVSVAGVNFGAPDGKLTYRFVPSVTGDAYTYKITFTGTDCKPQSFDAPCEGGACAGVVDISEYDSYTVNVLIENGEEGRSVPIAWNLSFSANSASWSS